MRSSNAFPLTLIVAGTALGLVWSVVSATTSPASSRLAWNDARNLSNSEPSSESAVVAASADTVHVVWVETVYGWPTIYHSYKNSDNNWSTPAPVEVGTQPDLAVGPDGTFDLVWLDEDGNFDFVRYRRWDSAIQAWVDAANVARGSLGTLQSPAVAVGSGGASHVVWVDTVTGSPRIRHRRRSASGWDDPENVPFADGTTPDVSVDVEGEVHLVWVGSSLFGEIHDIYYLWKDPQSGWSEARFSRVLSDDRPFVDYAAPSASVDRLGTLHVSWRESSGGSSTIWHRSGREWHWPSKAQAVARPTGRAEAPAIAVDEGRFVHLAFAGANGIAYYVRDARGVWQAGAPIVVDQPAATSPDLAAVGEGTVHAVWTAPGVAGRTDVFYRGMRPGLEPTQTPTFTPTTVATTTPVATLTPTATSSATSTPTSTSVATSTPTVTLTPADTSTPGPTEAVSPTPSPTTTWTPSPAPTEVLQHKTYLPLILQDFSQPEEPWTTSWSASSLARQTVHTTQHFLVYLRGLAFVFQLE